MAKHIPDLELLQLNDNILKDDIDNKHTPTSPSIRRMDTQNNNHDEAEGILETQHTPKPQYKKIQ